MAGVEAKRRAGVAGVSCKGVSMVGGWVVGWACVRAYVCARTVGEVCLLFQAMAGLKGLCEDCAVDFSGTALFIQNTACCHPPSLPTSNLYLQHRLWCNIFLPHPMIQACVSDSCGQPVADPFGVCTECTRVAQARERAAYHSKLFCSSKARRGVNALSTGGVWQGPAVAMKCCLTRG
jgi:hypothetical protein